MPTTEAAATYFAPGTLIGQDREGVTVHVGDVVESQTDFRPKRYDRGTVRYDARSGAFEALRCPRPLGGNVRVIRRWDDPRGPVQEGDPILQPSSEPWDRTVRVRVSRTSESVLVPLDPALAWDIMWVSPEPVASAYTPGTLDTVTGVFTPDPERGP